MEGVVFDIPHGREAMIRVADAATIKTVLPAVENGAVQKRWWRNASDDVDVVAGDANVIGITKLFSISSNFS